MTTPTRTETAARSVSGNISQNISQNISGNISGSVSGSIWNSRLARRLVAVFLAVASVPLLVSLAIVGRIGKALILTTGQTMEHINAATVRDAGSDFQRLGRASLSESSTRVTALSVSASREAARQWQRDQKDALAATAGDFSRITRGSITGAMHQSLATNQDILKNVSRETDELFARSAQRTARHSAGRVEQAMSTQIGTLMQNRAQQLADRVNNHIQNHLDYLALTAEMLDPRAGGAASDKPVLDALVRRYPMLTQVAVTDVTGREIAASAPDRVVTPSELADRSKTAYVRAGLADRTYVGVEKPSQGGNAPVLRLAVPVELYRGKVIGVLAATLSLDDLWDEIRTVHIGATGFASVTDDAGADLLPRPAPGPLLRAAAPVPLLHWRITVAEPRAEVMAPIEALRHDILTGTDTALTQMHSQLQNSSRAASVALLADSQRQRAQATQQLQDRTQDIFQRLAQRTARQADADTQEMQQAIQRQVQIAQGANSSRMAAAADATSSRLAARMTPLTAQAMQHAGRRLSVFAVAVMVVTSLLGCAAALLLATRLVGPLIRLAQGTRDIAAGNLSGRVDERATDEIGDLAVAFNQMAASLQQSRAELRETEAQLIQSAKLASLGTLSAGVAHELNQPVAIVRGIAQQLQDDPALPTDLKEDLELIEGQTGRMMKIIKHLRTFCRAGGYEMIEVNPYTVLQDCFVLIDAQLKSHNVRVAFDLGDEPPLVNGDANELEQVFLNLITNARDAMEDCPDACLTIRGRIEGGRCVMEFADNGPGIPEAAFAHIFDPFFTTKEAGKGTGLGLSISHGIIEKHGGAMTARNEAGAVFTLILPCTESAAAEAPLAKAA